GLNFATGSYTLTIDCTPDKGGPDNDDCANAEVITDGATGFDTEGATTDGPAHPECDNFGDDQVNQDIWFDYVATCTGQLTISTCGDANFDTRIAAYAGSGCPATQENLLGCNDDSPGCAGFTSELMIVVLEGESYKIRLGAFGDGVGQGQLSLNCIEAGTVPNDLCNNAIEIFEGQTPFDTTGATTDGSPHDDGVCPEFFFGDDQIYNDIWYEYTATCSGELFVSMCGEVDFDTRLAVYENSGCPVFDADLLACNDDAPGCGEASELAVAVVEGESYLIRVGGFSLAEQGPGTLSLSFQPVLLLEADTPSGGYMMGETVTVELHMLNLCGNPAAGFQAFLSYDPALLSFVSGTYTPTPFGLHILAPISASMGDIDLAAGINQLGGQKPTTDDALLATLTFTAAVDLCRADLDFRTSKPPTRITDVDGNELSPLLLIDDPLCLADLNGDGVVNVDDLVILILAWGTDDCDADISLDGTVGVDDLILLLISWGPCPTI
ncbi:MAG: hypothetical protein ACYTGC_04755, partial [Planctomycetota bacterium]